MRARKHCTVVTTVLAAALLSAAPASAAESDLKAKVTRSTGMIAGLERTFLLYVPPGLKPGAPLVMVFHGGGQDAKDLRIATGFEFDLLADKYGFVAVYPDGIDRGWNACRRSAQRNPRSVDDIAFIQSIIAHQAATNGIDKKRVFATGHSNGGAISYRLALEYPEEFAGVAAISSSLPARQDMLCTPKNVPIPMMIVNGTADPVNPYRGGANNRRIAVASDPLGGMGNAMGGGMGDQMSGARSPAFSGGGGRSRGPVMSTIGTAEYFAKLNGHAESPERAVLPHINPKDTTSVERFAWTAPGKPPVVLYSIIGGGHLVPQKYFRYPSIVGRQTEDMDAPEIIWEFFAGLPGRP